MNYQPPSNDNSQNPQPYVDPSSQPSYSSLPQSPYASQPAQQSMPVDISQLAATYRVGTVLRQYKNTATGKMVLGIVMIVLGVLLVLLLLLILLSPGFSRVPLLTFLLGIGSLSYFGNSLIGKAVRNRGAQLYLCTDGLLRVKPGAIEVARWDQITAVQKVFSNASLLDGYILHQADRPPVVLEKTFGQFKELGAEIERQVTQRLLPGAIAAYQAGTPVNFGPVSVTSQGISVPAEQKILPWEELGDVSVSNGFIVIKKKGARRAWKKLSPTLKIPNLCIFLALVNHISGK